MTCNCNDNCVCNEEIKDLYLDDEGLLYYTQLLKLVLEEKYQFLQSISSNGDTITFKFTDGTTQKIKLDEGNATTKGMVRLSDSITDEANGVNSGVAATPKAVNAVHKEVKAIKDSPASLLTGLSVAEMKKFSNAIIQNGGGLGVDDDGKLYVDFDKMPDDKFDNLKKSLEIPIWVKADGDGESNDLDGEPTYGDWYVDKSAPGADDDTKDIVDKTTKKVYRRGQSKAYPFKSLQKCIDYVTKYFNVLSHTVRINVNGTEPFNGSWTLPTYARTSGRIQIVAYEGTTLTLQRGVNTPVAGGDLIHCVGGYWGLVKVNTNYVLSGNHTSSTTEARAFFAGGGAHLNVYGGTHTFVDQAEFTAKVLNGVYVADGNGTVLYVYGGNATVTPKDYTNAPEGTVKRNTYVVSSRYSANLNIPSRNAEDYEKNPEYSELIVNGKATCLMRATRGGCINYVAGQTYKPKFKGNIAAQRYYVADGSKIILNSGYWTEGEDANLTSGYSETATFSVYKVGSSVNDDD